MLRTNLKHIEQGEELKKIISEKENVVVCCGRNGPMCIPVFYALEKLETEYQHVNFFVMEFDNPESHIIRNSPYTRGFMGLPFVMYYKNGQVVKATSSIQTKEQIKDILDAYF